MSTYPPKHCGLATFTHALIQALHGHEALPQQCHIGIIALSDPSDNLVYTDPAVDFDLRYDHTAPSQAMVDAVHYIHKAAYTHIIIQQVAPYRAHASF